MESPTLQPDRNVPPATVPFGSTPEERIVQRHSVELFGNGKPLELAGGRTLGPITVVYETYGQLNEACDNAIYVCHALTGDSHAAGRYQLDDRKPGWWDDFIGPGCGLDTDRYCVICANVLGGCQGTTGPSSIDPQTGKPFGLNFPFLTVADIVKVHRELVAHLGIEKLAGLVGGSLGGMQVLEWMAQTPESVRNAIVLASAANLSAQGIAFNAVGRRAIYADPKFRNGEYYDVDPTDSPSGETSSGQVLNKPGSGPRFGLALARMIAHITYLSESSIEKKFGRRLQDSDELAFDLMRETEFQIESYLHYQGKQFVDRFDANSYLYLTKAMDYFDLAESHGSLRKALERTTARVLVASYTTDWLFPTSQSREIVSSLLSAGCHASFCELESAYGHDAFLIDIPQLTELVRAFLNE
ncbi:MAG: homoserine O-acetyltransferase [Planctomycetaceae bacterium]|nr:homoserine O-acetyltransferase [Planctomycetaceae bacterium]